MGEKKKIMCTEFKMPTQLKKNSHSRTWMSPFLVAFYLVCVLLGCFLNGGEFRGGENKLFFSLAVLLLLYCCNFVRHCVCRHVMCFTQLLIRAHIVTLSMYIDFLVQGLNGLRFRTNTSVTLWGWKSKVLMHQDGFFFSFLYKQFKLSHLNLFYAQWYKARFPFVRFFI